MSIKLLETDGDRTIRLFWEFILLPCVCFLISRVCFTVFPLLYQYLFHVYRAGMDWGISPSSIIPTLRKPQAHPSSHNGFFICSPTCYRLG